MVLLWWRGQHWGVAGVPADLPLKEARTSECLRGHEVQEAAKFQDSMATSMGATRRWGLTQVPHAHSPRVPTAHQRVARLTAGGGD